MRFLLSVALLCISSSILAKPLPQFKAVFDVEVYGFNVGEVTQTFICENNKSATKNCTLTSEARPPSWAERFINESAIEKISIAQSKNSFNWLQYQKHLTRHYEDRTEKKTITLTKDIKNKLINFVEKNKTWDIQNKIFDKTSITYAIQHAMINNTSLQDFYLQSDKQQQKLIIEVVSEEELLDIPYDDYVNTSLIIFKNANIHAKVWLLNEQQYFPARIEINNKKTDKTITLELSKLRIL